MIHRCPCGGEDYRESRFLHFATCRLVACVRCGLMRTVPEPRPEATAVIYTQATEKYNLVQRIDPNRLDLWWHYSHSIHAMLLRQLRRPGRLLDIGCNFGDLLIAGRDTGWDVEGVEINQENAHLLTREGFRVFDRTLGAAVRRSGVSHLC